MEQKGMTMRGFENALTYHMWMLSMHRRVGPLM